MSEPINGAAEVGLTLFQYAAPLVAAGLTWLSARLAGFIRAKTKNEVLRAMMCRLNDSVLEAVLAVNQQTRELIGRARDPSSPGGTRITRDEASALKHAAVQYVVDYWGPKGLAELGKVLGFGTDEGAQRLVHGLIRNKIEVAVGSRKNL